MWARQSEPSRQRQPYAAAAQLWPCLRLDAAAAAELDDIIAIASLLRASIPADHPQGARASFADYLRSPEAGQAS